MINRTYRRNKYYNFVSNETRRSEKWVRFTFKINKDWIDENNTHHYDEVIIKDQLQLRTI